MINAIKRLGMKQEHKKKFAVLNFMVPYELREKVERLAAAEDRSISAQSRRLIEAQLEFLDKAA